MNKSTELERTNIEMRPETLVHAPPRSTLVLRPRSCGTRGSDLEHARSVVQTLDQAGEPRAVRRPRTGAEHIAYRRLIVTIVGMDVATLTSELRVRRLGLHATGELPISGQRADGNQATAETAKLARTAAGER